MPASIRTELEEPIPAQPDEHMAILQTLLKLAASDTTDRLGPRGQQPRRALEQRVRSRAVQVAKRLTERGYSYADLARRLAVSERTLRSWNGCSAAANLAPPLGRPLAASQPAQQQAVFSLLDRVGPGLGVPNLRTYFPGMARAELADLVKGYRHRWRVDNQRLIHALDWQRPGAVWAIDFAQAPSVIDGRYPYVLAVRDLASGQMLLWRPVAAQTAAVVIAELRWLFTLHGAPLVLKTDNGSAFIDAGLGRELQLWGVGQLFSPPKRPEYNGSIEASIGSLKKRTQHQCELAGHPAIWTNAAAAAAQLDANTTARLKRLRGLTPERSEERRVGKECRSRWSP